MQPGTGKMIKSIIASVLKGQPKGKHRPKKKGKK